MGCWQNRAGPAGCGWALLSVLLVGCQMPKIDVPGEASRATGISNAIAFHSEAGPVDVTPAAGNMLTLSDAVQRSLSNDPRIQAALARVRIAQAEAHQARLLPNPILNLDYRFAEGGGTAAFETSLTADLVAVLQKPLTVSAGDKKLRAASIEAVTTVLEVLSEVQAAYVAVQSVEAELQVLELRLQIMQRLLDLANARLKAGEGIRLDVLTIESQRLALQVEMTQFRLERTEQRLVLTRLIGEPSGAAAWELIPWQAPAAVRAGESAWLRAAIAKRPEIRSKIWELAALGDEIKLTTLAPLEGGEAGSHAEHGTAWDVGPDITTPVPIFDWGQAKRAKAVAQRIEARHQLTQLQRQVVEEVRRAYAVYAASQQTLRQAQTQLIPLQQQRREQAELAYRSGEADLTTLLLAESDLQETRAKLVELQEKVTVAMIKLQRAVGGAGIANAVEAGAPTTLPTSRPAATGSPR